MRLRADEYILKSGLPRQNRLMKLFVKNSLLALLLALLGSRANSASICETIPLPLAADRARAVQDFGHAKEGTKESYTQGVFTKAIHQFAPPPLVPFRVIVPTRRDVVTLDYYSLQAFCRSSFYYSSFCNKAPPTA